MEPRKRLRFDGEQKALVPQMRQVRNIFATGLFYLVRLAPSLIPNLQGVIIMGQDNKQGQQGQGGQHGGGQQQQGTPKPGQGGQQQGGGS